MSEATDHHDQISERKAKLARLRQAGIAYPKAVKPSTCAARLHQTYADTSKETLEADKHQVTLCGRMMTCRMMGKASFVHIKDDQQLMQLYIRQNDVGEAAYQDFKTWDLGDIITVSGWVFRTQKGELSVHCQSIGLLTKALRPLPDKFHGLADQEIRYRQRYLDLISNAESNAVFRKRCLLIQAIREFLVASDFIEVETPMLHPIPGGAVAKPFVTHHHALGQDLYLRIAPELYLKRLIVGGWQRVFEINRNFRNEGLSTRHNPEFTELEFYQAHATYEDLMQMTEEMMQFCIKKVLDGKLSCDYQGHTIDFGKSFKRLPLFDAARAAFPDWPDAVWHDQPALCQQLRQAGLHADDQWGLGRLWLEVFEEKVEKTLIQPTFVIGYPKEVSPLARVSDHDAQLTDRFELFIGGFEVANAFSELNDPEDQAQRFREQAAARTQGDDEAMFYDADYVQALEYGMPPTAGEGIGIDRLAMILTGVTAIRDVLFFPSLKPKVHT